MENFLLKFDSLAGIKGGTAGNAWLERLAFFFLVLMAVTAPHSIAASQGSWLLGTLFWVARLFLKPRPDIRKTFLLVPFAAYFGWSILSTLFSHAPDLSADRLRNVALFFIFYFAVNNLRSLHAVRFVVFALLLSTMVNVVWVPVQRLIGRGVEIHSLLDQSPLKNARFQDGDALLKVNGKKIGTPEEIVNEIEKNGSAGIEFYRPDFYETHKIYAGDLLKGSSPEEKLGIGSWKVSRNWRSSGFFGHYATYAEVMQLIASLAFGLLVGCLFTSVEARKAWIPKFSATSVLLIAVTGLMALALFLTVTRASQASFAFSVLLITAIGAGRKWILLVLTLMIPVVIGGLIFIQQSRNTAFLDSSDNSTTWRQTVYREGFELWSNSPRHIVFGIGMDSVKRYAKEWKFFDNGKLPPGHFHSTPLQILFERGLPTLVFWFWIMGTYIFSLYRAARKRIHPDWIIHGTLLGALGGATGFFISGLAHFNLGDGEVAMVFFLIMGIALAIMSITDQPPIAVIQDSQ